MNRFCRSSAVLLVWMLAATPARAAIEVPDDAGNRIRLAQPAQRIVSLAPNITELLFAAGAGGRLVGVSEYSDYPEAARSIRRIGGGNGLDLEAVIGLDPDLVIAWGSGNPERDRRRLGELGLTVFVSEPRRLQDIPDTLRRFGRMAGTDAVAERAAREFDRGYTDLQQRYGGRAPVRVFYQIWERPLMTVNGEHLISDVMRLCGGRNVFAALPELAPQLGVEAVLAANPEVIVAAGSGPGDSAVLAQWRRWPELAATAHAHLRVIDRDLLVRNTPRILQGAERLCAILDEVRGERTGAGDGDGG